MTDLQDRRYNMHLKVLSFLEEHESQTAPIPLVAECRAELEALMEQATAHAGGAMMNLTGYAEDKANKRTALIRTMEVLLPAARRVAATAQDIALARWARISPGRLRKINEADLHIHALNLRDHCLPHLAALATLGLGQADLDALSAAHASFYDAIPRPEKVLFGRKSDREAFVRIQKEMDHLLKTRLDLYMALFMATNRWMVMRYQLARTLRKRGSSPRQMVIGRSVLAGATVRTAPFVARTDTPLIITNTGRTPLRVVLLDAGRPVSATVEVGPGERHASTLADWATSGQMLAVSNPDPVHQGRFVAVIG